MQDFKKKFDLLQTKQLETSIFWNLALDKGTLKSFISWFLENYGEKKTLKILEELKNLGFGYATKAGISLGIEDLKIPPKKIELLANSERIFTEAQFSYRRGEITGIEKMQLFIETWTETSETLKDEVVSYFEKTDILNPVYMMAFSGARGNMSQVRQLVGMRGLMSDPQGKIIDFPIQSNFREGLTLTEYLISTYGARKGIVDTALRTATAGYLTRRLVDVAQHVVVSKFDCGTKRGIFLFDMKEGIKTIYSFQNRLMGRVLAQDIFENNTMVASRNQQINSFLAAKISKITKKALVRSPLTCQTRKLVCQLCYGWSLSNSKLVAIGEAVGVIAGQSIGEPGTQLTMRTFHTGGVFSSTVTEQINAPFEALIEYAEPIAGTCIRTPQGNFAFLTKTSGTLFCKKYQKNTSLNLMNTYKIPAFTLLFARHGQFVKKDELLGQVSAFPLSQKTTQTIEQTIYSSLEGEVYYNQLNLLDDIEEKYGERTSKSENWARVWVLSAKILKDSLNSKFFPYAGDYISKNSVMNQIEWVVPPSQSVQIQLKNPMVQKRNHSDYSVKFRTNSISTNFLQKQSFSKLPSISFENKDKQIFLTMEKKNAKKISGIFQILSNYKLNENFRMNSISLQKKNSPFYNIILNTEYPRFQYPPLSKVYLTSFGVLTQNRFLIDKNKLKKTDFKYPYQQTTRFYLTKILTQTSLTLPLLNPGVLKTWFEIKTNQKKTFSLSSKSAFNLSSPFEIVKKLNLTQKFEGYQHLLTFRSKRNSFYPLILANSIPFSLQSKTLKSFVQAKKLRKKDQTELLKKSLKLYKQLKTTTKDQGHFVEKIDLKIDNFPKLKFSLSSNSSNKLLPNISVASQYLDPGPIKFDQLSLTNSILTFKTYKTTYKRLGYFSHVFIEKSIIEKLFSFLPLNFNSFMTANKRELIQLLANKPSLHNSKLNSGYKTNGLQTFGLENTDQWNPNPIIGFNWFPKFSRFNSGLFVMNSSYFFYKNFHEKRESNLLKNPKFHLTYIKKYGKFLNLSQSQIIKKNTSSSRLIKVKWLKNFKPFLRLPTRKLELSRIFVNKKNQRNRVLPQFKSKNLETSFIKTSKYLSRKQNNFLLTSLSSKKFEKTRKPQNFQLIQSKHTQNKLKSLKRFILFTKFLELKTENGFNVFNKISWLQNLKFDLNKFFSFKERNLNSESLQILMIKFDPFEKINVAFNQIEFIPQENYHFKTTEFLKTIKCLDNQTSNFYFVKNSTHIHKKVSNFYLTNAQGFQKEFHACQEGFSLITKAKSFYGCQVLRKNIINKTNISEFENPFLLNFHYSKPQSLLSTDPFRETSEFSNVEFTLKSNLLKYIKTKHAFKCFKFFANTVNIKFLKDKNVVYTIQKSSRSRLGFIPFLKNRVKSATEERVLESLKVAQPKNSRLELIEFQMSIKPGWIYKPTNVYKALDLHKKIVASGTVIVDNIYFSQEKVFTEIIQIKNNSCNIQMEGLSFEIGCILKNRNARFLKVSSETSQQKINLFYLLIRPVQSQLHPNLQDSKKKLYNSVQQARLNYRDKSYFLYSQFFSHNCNQQKKSVKTLSNFPPLDIKLESNDLFSFSNSLYYFQKEKTLKLKSKLNKKMKHLHLKQKNLKASFSLLKFLLTHSIKTGNEKILSAMIYKPVLLKKHPMKSQNAKNNSSFDVFYFSNYPTNFFKLSISLNVSNPKSLDFSFSKIFFNLTSSNVYLFKNFSKQIYQKLKLNYLNLLILRNYKNRSEFDPSSFFSNFLPCAFDAPGAFAFRRSESRRQAKAEDKQKKEVLSQNKFSLKSFKFKKQKYPLKNPFLNEKNIQYYFAVTCFSPNCLALPKFEYVFDQTYGFLGNQKLFATSFYKQQFDMSLNLNLFENLALNLKTNKNKQFLQKHFKNRNLYRSYHSLLSSKNFFIFKNQLLNLKPSFNLTNFYSSFEGEILKDYFKETDLESLKRSLNINTENALLSERQAEKLILTKSDLFGLTFPSKMKFEKHKPNLESFSLLLPTSFTYDFFTHQTTKTIFDVLFQSHQTFRLLETNYFSTINSQGYTISQFNTNYANKVYKVKNLSFSVGNDLTKFRLGKFINPGDNLYCNSTFLKSGQIIHLNSKKLTLRKAEFFAISPKAILHTYNGHSITKNAPVMTLPFETLKTGDIVQGIPKVEQYLEARTTIQGRLFLNSLPVLLHAIYHRYSQKLSLEKAVRQSFLKIQQILVDGVQRVYRSQGVSIADKHLEIIVRQMTSKVKIVYGGQTGFFAGELVDLEFVERVNRFLMVKIQYEPIVLGITRSSLEVDSFLSAASFQQTTKVLTKAALENKKDFLKGLKENLLVGNLLPAGTGYVIPLS